MWVTTVDMEWCTESNEAQGGQGLTGSTQKLALLSIADGRTAVLGGPARRRQAGVLR